MKGLTSMGLKENGKRKMDSACRMFLLNSVKHKKIGNAYINERGQFIHLSVSTVKLFSISPVWYHQRNVIIMWTDMVGSRSVLVQTANIHPHAPPPNTRTHAHSRRCMCALSQLVPPHYWKQFLQCLWSTACSMQSKSQPFHTKGRREIQQ